MKKYFIAVLCYVLFLSCSKRVFTSAGSDSGNVFVDSSANTTSASTMLIVADGYGRLITPQQNLPQNAGLTYNSLQLSKSFTTQQRANLQARYKTIPPRVVYVPQQQVLSSLKGSYYIFKNKFWYWKKADGLFYLDEKYYL